MDRTTLLGKVKRKVHEVCPDAEIILYGSRARGANHSDSDWDFLILTDEDARRITDPIRHIGSLPGTESIRRKQDGTRCQPLKHQCWNRKIWR